MDEVILKAKNPLKWEEYRNWKEVLNAQSNSTRFIIIPENFDIITINLENKK